MRACTLTAGKGVGYIAQVLLRTAEAPWTERAVLDGALVDAVSTLVVAQKRRYHNHIWPVVHGIAEVTELAVVARDHGVWVTFSTLDEEMSRVCKHDMKAQLYKCMDTS